MNNFYKAVIVLFLLFIGINLYGITWELGFMHEENGKFVMAIGASLLAIILVFVLNTWSKLSVKR